MTARCHNDSCSVAWSEVDTLDGLKYQADVRLDDDGGIECDEELGGLYVSLVNDAPVASGCQNILRRNILGQLHATLPAIQYADFGNVTDNTSIAIDRNTNTPGGFAVSVETYQFTNDSGCDALFFAHGSFLLSYGIIGEDEAFPANTPDQMQRAANLAFGATTANTNTAQEMTPYNAQWYASLLAGVGSVPTNVDANARAVRNFPTSGVIFTPTDDGHQIQFQNVRTGWTFATPLAAGATIYLKHRWAHQGPDQTINVVAGGTGAPFEDLGGFLVGQALLFPMAGDGSL